MPLINEEKLRIKLERFLTNYICSACDNSSELERLKTASCEELLKMAKKYRISTEEE